MKDKFIEIMHSEIGKRYALGGGQMKEWIHKDKKTKKIIAVYQNKNSNGKWVGFDCCGGIMFALKKATGINLILRNVPGMMQAPWLYEIKKNELKESDLIFVDVPGKDENGDVKRDKNGYPVYGVYNHVMTYKGMTSKGDIITTMGAGGDFRINPKSKTVTNYWLLESFQKVSSKIYEDTTQYKYFRINWDWLKFWKKNH